MIYDINVGGWVMRKIKTLFIVSLFLFGCILIFLPHTVSSGGISIWPGKLTITMHDEYPEEEIRYEIEVNNLNQYDINVSATAENPALHNLKENYMFIPDLSWVSITPEILHIPSKESRFLEVNISIPDEEKPLYYDEHWHVCTVVSENNDRSTPGSTVILTELAVNFFIITPSSKATMEIQNIYILLAIIISAIITLIAIFYVKKKKKDNS